jgi:hypothetical protein
MKLSINGKLSKKIASRQRLRSDRLLGDCDEKKRERRYAVYRWYSSEVTKGRSNKSRIEVESDYCLIRETLYDPRAAPSPFFSVLFEATIRR